MHLSDCTTFEPIIRLSQTSSQLTRTRRLTMLSWDSHPNTLINQTGRSSSTSFHGSVLNSIIWWTTVRQGLTKPKWHARTCVIIGNRRKSLSAQPEVPGIHHRPCPLDQQRQRVECPKLCVWATMNIGFKERCRMRDHLAVLEWPRGSCWRCPEIDPSTVSPELGPSVRVLLCTLVIKIKMIIRRGTP